MKKLAMSLLLLVGFAFLGVIISLQLKKDASLREANRQAVQVFRANVKVGDNRAAAIQRMNGEINWSHVQCMFWDHRGAMDLFYFQHKGHYFDPYEVISDYKYVHGDQYIVKNIGIIGDSLCVDKDCLPPDFDRADYNFTICP